MPIHASSLTQAGDPALGAPPLCTLPPPPPAAVEEASEAALLRAADQRGAGV